MDHHNKDSHREQQPKPGTKPAPGSGVTGGPPVSTDEKEKVRERRHLEPTEDFAQRPGSDIESEGRDHTRERERSDADSGRPVQLEEEK